MLSWVIKAPLMLICSQKHIHLFYSSDKYKIIFSVRIFPVQHVYLQGSWSADMPKMSLKEELTCMTLFRDNFRSVRRIKKNVLVAVITLTSLIKPLVVFFRLPSVVWINFSSDFSQHRFFVFPDLQNRYCDYYYYSTKRKEQYTTQELIGEKHNFSNLSDHTTNSASKTHSVLKLAMEGLKQSPSSKCLICHCTAHSGYSQSKHVWDANSWNSYAINGISVAHYRNGKSQPQPENRKTTATATVNLKIQNCNS